MGRRAWPAAARSTSSSSRSSPAAVDRGAPASAADARSRRSSPPDAPPGEFGRARAGRRRAAGAPICRRATTARSTGSLGLAAADDDARRGRGREALLRGTVADRRRSATARCSSRRSRSGRGSSSSAPSRSPARSSVSPRELGLRDRRRRRPGVVRDAGAVPADVDRLVVGWPDEVADEIGLGPNDAVAVLTHDVKFDEPAIVEALRRGCRYVGAVGSKKTQADRRARLREAGVSDARARPPARPGRARPRRSEPGRDGARDHRRGRRRALRRERRAARTSGPRGDRRPARSRRMTVAAVVLAAGAGSRFGGGKLLRAPRRPADPRPRPRRWRAAGGLDRSSSSSRRRGALDDRRPRRASDGSSTRTRPRACRARSGSGSARSSSTPGVDAAAILPGDQPLRPRRRDPRPARRPRRQPGHAVRRARATRTTAARTRSSPGARSGAWPTSSPAIAGSGRSWPTHPELVRFVRSTAPTPTSTRRPTSTASRPRSRARDVSWA